MTKGRLSGPAQHPRYSHSLAEKPEGPKGRAWIPGAGLDETPRLRE